MPFAFGTKADTLHHIGKCLNTCHVLPHCIIPWPDWVLRPGTCVDAVLQEQWSHQELIVRSSRHSEDAPGHSRAGQYRTVVNVRGRAALEHSIQQVFQSYGDND